VLRTTEDPFNNQLCEMVEWVTHQHILSYLVPYNG